MQSYKLKIALTLQSTNGKCIVVSKEFTVPFVPWHGLAFEFGNPDAGTDFSVDLDELCWNDEYQGFIAGTEWEYSSDATVHEYSSVLLRSGWTQDF